MADLQSQLDDILIKIGIIGLDNIDKGLKNASKQAKQFGAKMARSMGTFEPIYTKDYFKDGSFDTPFKHISKSINEAQNQLLTFTKTAKGTVSQYTNILKKSKEYNTLEGAIGQTLATKGKVFTNYAAKRFNVLKSQVGHLFEEKKLWGMATGMATNHFKQIELKAKKAANTMKKPKVAFAGWAMSIMFFGMAIQRVFTSIWKSSYKTFQDVMHSVEGTVTKFDLLEGSMAYLKFTAGQALEPIVGFLIPIIDAVSEWILNNEGLFRGIVTVGTILGTIFAVGGAGVLAINGFAELALKLGILKANADGVAKVNWKGMFGWMSTPVGAGVLAALAAVAIIGGLSWKAFNETPEAWKALKDTFKSLKEDFKPIKDSIENLIKTMLPEFQLNWETIAWTIVWVSQIITGKIKIWINFFSMLINIISLAVTVIKEFAKNWWYLNSLQFDKIDFSSSLSAVTYQANKIWDSAKNLWGSMETVGINQPTLSEFLAENVSRDNVIVHGDIIMNVKEIPGESAADMLRRLRQEVGIY